MGAVTLEESALFIIFFTHWKHILRPLAIPIMEQYMKSVSRVSVCVSNLKTICHASNYELKVSFSFIWAFPYQLFVP